ncbi:hypothetical protein Tco_1318718 [Tanacetum coccineum]
MAYHDKYKKILDEIWKDKVELDGKIIKEEEEAVKRIKSEALKEKDDPGAFIFPIRLEGLVNKNALANTGSDIYTMPYRIYEQLGREEMKKVDRGITMINHTQTEAMGILTNVLCQLLVGDSCIRLVSERLFSTFDGFCHQTFHAARSDVMRNAKSDSDDEEEYHIKRNKFGASIYGPKPAPYLNCNDPAERSLAIQIPLKHVNWKPDYKGSYTKEEEATGQWCTEIRLTDPYGNIYLQGFTTKKTDRKLSKYHKLSDIMSPNWYCFHKSTMRSCYGKDVAEMQSLEIDDMLRIRLHEAGMNEEIFTSMAWIKAFNINEPIYAELCHKFYSTYEFDKVCADDELQTKKIIKFRLGGRAHRGLRSDEHFNAQEYWLSISREENLGLSRSHTSTIRNPILRVIHKMITYGLYQRTTGVLTEDVVKILSASIYYRDLDTITLRDLIDSEGKLIPEDPQPGVPVVGIPRSPRTSMQDLYDRMGRMEIRQEGAYNPPGYAQQQYDQYYQQYPPPPQYPPYYQQQQQDDDE